MHSRVVHLPKRVFLLPSPEGEDEDSPLLPTSFPTHSMGSQPDFEAAHRLNPDKFPMNPRKELIQSESVITYLADQLAKVRKCTREEVLIEARKMAGAEMPQVSEAKLGKEQKAVQKVEKDRAGFFAHKERSTYYPIDMLETEPFNEIDQSQLRFFQNEEEAQANGFTAAEPVAPELTGEQTEPPAPPAPAASKAPAKAPAKKK